MPPKLYLVRHAEGYHNSTRDFTLPDPVLTDKGKSQCHALQTSFQHHNDINLVLASPLRRTIQTASLSFGPVLEKKEVPFILLPLVQEVSDMGCDTGSSLDELKQVIPKLFAEDHVKFDLTKIDFSEVKEGWNNKTGYYAYTRHAISKRASDVRNYLFQRPEANVLVVTHGAFLHFLTEDWDVDGNGGGNPLLSTAYHNCEVRIFDFTSESTSSDAHVVETAESKRTRRKDEPETDPVVLEELSHIVG